MEILEIKNIAKSFGGLIALRELSLSFSRQKITSLIGPNGAGKTTLFHLITGFTQPDSGEIIFQKQVEQTNKNDANDQKCINLVGLSPWEISLLGIGRLFQDVRVFNNLKVLDNIMVGSKNQEGENPLAAVFKFRAIKRFDNIVKERARYWLNFVGLSGNENSFAEDLSYGQQKLLAIARLLMNDAEILLLDEPTAGIHHEFIDKILDLLRKIVNEGKTIVIIEHNMNVVLEVSDWVFLLDEGEIASFGLPKEVFEDPVLKEVYLGV